MGSCRSSLDLKTDIATQVEYFGREEIKKSLNECAEGFKCQSHQQSKQLKDQNSQISTQAQQDLEKDFQQTKKTIQERPPGLIEKASRQQQKPFEQLSGYTGFKNSLFQNMMNSANAIDAEYEAIIDECGNKKVQHFRKIQQPALDTKELDSLSENVKDKLRKHILKCHQKQVEGKKVEMLAILNERIHYTKRLDRKLETSKANIDQILRQSKQKFEHLRTESSSGNISY